MHAEKNRRLHWLHERGRVQAACHVCSFPPQIQARVFDDLFLWLDLATTTWLTRISPNHALAKLTDGLTLLVEKKNTNLFFAREIRMPCSTDLLGHWASTRRYWLDWALEGSVCVVSCKIVKARSQGIFGRINRQTSFDQIKEAAQQWTCQ